MKLIGSLTSPYVRKVRVVMAEKKLDYELVIDDVWSADAIITEHNPLGKVPCLAIDDFGNLFDSRVIVEYLDTLSPVSRLLPQTGRDRALVKLWEAAADGLMDAAISIHIEKNQRATHQQNPAWIARQQEKITRTLAYLETQLGENSFCSGINFSLADIAVGCALGYLDLRFKDLDWRAQHEQLARLCDKLYQRPSFIQTQP
ncbi:MAG TPA: glutathione S-transferase C-terminal domain-containing protein [Paenalcaligenes sp.]|nr:glutathione S-transferase C-terminal domain-containing protein [Paenalcaligenes sp.]